MFQHLAQAQDPEKFTVQYLKDLGFASTNFRAVVPLLKALGFLSDDGVPTSRYHEYRNTALSKQVMAAALRDAYSDLFTIRANPTAADRRLIEGKFRSVHNATPNTAKLMASTFYALLEMADLSLPTPPKKEDDKPEKKQEGEAIVATAASALPSGAASAAPVEAPTPPKSSSTSPIPRASLLKSPPPAGKPPPAPASSKPPAPPLAPRTQPRPLSPWPLAPGPCVRCAVTQPGSDQRRPLTLLTTDIHPVCDHGNR